jgi:hypothetical protein
MKAFEDGLRLLVNNFSAKRLSHILDGWYLWELVLPTSNKALFVINEYGVHISYHLVSKGNGDRTRAFQKDMRMAKIFADLTLDGPESVHFDMTRRDFHVESAVTAIVKVVEDKSAEEDRVTSSNQKVQPNIIPQKST